MLSWRVVIARVHVLDLGTRVANHDRSSLILTHANSQRASFSAVSRRHCSRTLRNQQLGPINVPLIFLLRLCSLFNVTASDDLGLYFETLLIGDLFDQRLQPGVANVVLARLDFAQILWYDVSG